MQCRVNGRNCQSMDQGCWLPYSGEDDSIHLWSGLTGVADEIMCDFVRHMFNCQISF